MAPRCSCSVSLTRLRRSRHSADCRGGRVATLATAHCRRHCRRRLLRLDLCLSGLRRRHCVRVTLLRRVTDVAAAAVNTNDSVRAARRRSVTESSTFIHRSNTGVQHHHVTTLLHDAAIVDELAKQLSQLQLQTDTQSSSLKDDIKLLEVSSSLPADSIKRCKSASTSSESRQSTADNSKCWRHNDTTSHDPRLCTDELQHATSMIVLLRRACRIPRPLPLPPPVTVHRVTQR